MKARLFGPLWVKWHAVVVAAVVAAVVVVVVAAVVVVVAAVVTVVVASAVAAVVAVDIFHRLFPPFKKVEHENECRRKN